MAQKPEGSVPRKPRRLFSFDSHKSSPSAQRSASESSFTSASSSSSLNHFRIPSQPTLLENVDEEPLVSPRAPFFGRSHSPGPNSEKTKRRPQPLAVDRSLAQGIDGAPRSPSLIRWQTIRQHVLPVEQQPLSASSSSSSLVTPSRSQPPKPSRFGPHRAFRQVVEQAREFVQDDTRRLDQELQRACLAARTTEAVKTNRADQYLPFMSATHLPGQDTPQRPGMRRPPSVQSLALSSRGQQPIPSLNSLYQTLLHNCRQSPDAALSVPILPSEPHVLATLLSPFLTVDTTARVEQERRYAFESFDIIIKTWKPPNETVAIERCKWICKAALIPHSTVRVRLLHTLRAVLSDPECPYQATHTASVQALGSALFTLLPTVQGSGEEHNIVVEAVVHLFAGDYGVLDLSTVEEQFGIRCAPSETRQESLRHALILDALARTLENSADSVRRWLLKHVVDEYWPRQPDNVLFTPLLGAIQARKLATFTRMGLSGLRSRPSATSYQGSTTVIAEYVVHFVQTRVVPELAAIPSDSVTVAKRTGTTDSTVPTSRLLPGDNISAVDETRRNVVAIGLELLHPGAGARELGLWAMTVLSEWYRDTDGKRTNWKTSIDEAVQRVISEGQWPVILSVLSALLDGLPEDVRKPLIVVLLPTLTQRLTYDPPPHPSLPLTALLTKLAELYPPIFYRPLFLCAAATSEISVAEHLVGICALARFVPDYWTKDAEMIGVALVGGGGSKTKNPSGDTGKIAWGTARLGQSVLLVEVIGRIQAVRRAASLSQQLDIIRFALALETRVGILLEVKERASLITLSQRMLFMMLFRELRLLTKSLKTASWLPRLVSWFTDFHQESHLNDDSDLEFITATNDIQQTYTTARNIAATPRGRNRATIVMSASYDGTFNTNPAMTDSKIGLPSAILERAALVSGLNKGFPHKALKLFVTMATILTVDDLLSLGPLIWEHHLRSGEISVVGSASSSSLRPHLETDLFLVKGVLYRHAMCRTDSSRNDGTTGSGFSQVCVPVCSDDTTRLEAVRKINTLVNWRFQIMSQQVLIDRNHRAFKFTRGPLAFVATDMGTGQFIREQDTSNDKDAIPPELRKRLVEIGWADDDEEVDQHLEWVKTPISNLPALYLDRLELPGADQNAPIAGSGGSTPSPAPSPRASPSPSADKFAEEVALLRRNSSSGGPIYGGKRRAIFVPSLAAIFPTLANKVFDPNFLIAATARGTVIDLMRNDPALLTRPVFELFAGAQKDMTTAISSLRAFLHIRRTLPPPLTHNLLNSIAGFLKGHLKVIGGGDDLLYDFALVMPILAKLVTQVSGMSMREIRRAKIEAFLIPSGSLWFPSSAPAGPMFPRQLGAVALSDEIPHHLVHVSMIRLSQNMLFLSILKRNPQDVQMIRKSMTRLVLPSLDHLPDAPTVELKDLVPVPGEQAVVLSYLQLRVQSLSMIVSRSYLLLIAQIFRSMSRHLSDRSELGVLVDGVSRILLAHGSDIGIVAHSLIALMVASTRFRRLFTSGGGYTLFVPVLIKVYTEAEGHAGIRLAIEYAFNRFYALHREAFIFQSIDSMAAVMALPNLKGDWVAKNIYTLLATLTRPIPLNAPDHAAIRGVNKIQEREALLFSTADEKPQTFLASMQKNGDERTKVLVNIPEEYESKRLGIDNIVRLFFTVIAHDPAVLRAEQFLRFLRHLTPYLYNASSSARTLLKEGIEALGVITMRPFVKSKGNDPSLRVPEEPSMDSMISGVPEATQPSKTKLSSDILAMRLDYLSLILNFTKAGGLISPPASHRALDLIKHMFRDHDNEVREPISSFLAEYTKNCLIRESANARTVKSVVAFLGDLSSLLSSFALSLDFSGVFSTLTQLCGDPTYANEPTFSNVLVNQICSFALNACEQAAAEKQLLSLPSRYPLVLLICQAITLNGADVIAEVIRRRPSYEFMSGIILPICLHMKTGEQVMASAVRTEPWHLEAHRNTWIRLLGYTMTACQQPMEANPRTRSKSPDRRLSSGNKSPMTIFVVGLQVIKVVIVRAREDLDMSFPGIWTRVALFLKMVLAEGSGTFALRPTREYSPNASPISSPRSSSQFDLGQPFHKSNFNSSRPLPSPRIVDYVLWSFLEMLVAFRTPLLLHMRLFAQEKVSSLSQEIHQYNTTTSPSPSRPVSTAFSKPRRRSMMPSPEASPGLSPTQSFVNIPHPSMLSLDTSFSRQAGFYQPSSPRDIQGAGPIVHLGPTTSSGLFAPSSSGGRIRAMVKSTRVRSLVLVHATYRRIRLVQKTLGYDNDLLPAAQMLVEDSMPTWTAAQAMECLARETQEIMEEFEEAFWSAGDDMVVVDPDQSMNFSLSFDD
ncbi:RRM domain-containing protein [Mycena indigotica]|uniref:RRM domain-containing protein n=1 Tax=Mycena indigotica TaxID=2126181 RepID=A0A8H6WEV6_9AGAR|nr:RRM domain-containing protein [Mycena indigotica]KAF7316109.1 RRM domain-containing protein [Mycena indigotica]